MDHWIWLFAMKQETRKKNVSLQELCSTQIDKKTKELLLTPPAPLSASWSLSKVIELSRKFFESKETGRGFGNQTLSSLSHYLLCDLGQSYTIASLRFSLIWKWEKWHLQLRANIPQWYEQSKLLPPNQNSVHHCSFSGSYLYRNIAGIVVF